MNLTKEEKSVICEASLERVLNNALWIAGKALNSRNPELAERAGVLIDDLEGRQDMLRVASNLWDHTRNEIFKGNL